MMNRYKRFILLLAVYALYGASLKAQPLAGQHASGKPVNVIVLLADDMTAKTIRSLGNKAIITPNLDQLVKEGTSFPHAYIMGGTYGAVCLPSRAMLMTGKNLFHLEKNGNVIPANHTLIGEALIANGYQSYGIGKWHNGTASYARSFSGGDEIMFGGMTMNQFAVPLTHFNKDGNYNTFCKPGDNAQICDHIVTGKHSAEIFADAAINFLSSGPAQKPFFLYVAFTTPHDPRQMPDKYRAMYDLSKIELPANFMPVHPFDNGALDGRDENLLPHPRKPEAVRQEILDYYATITHLDAQVGRIIDALKKSGQYQHTIIVFAGDNGLAVGQHGLMGKQNVYEHSVGVPMIWSGPGIAKNKRSEAYTYLTDIYPTIFDVLGIQKPASVDGKSFSRCLTNSKAEHRQTMYFSFKDIQRAVSDHRYKLIEYNVAGARHTQVFDLKNDPGELNNLFGNPDYAIITNRLKKELLSSKVEFDDNSPFWKGY